ncbi:MAG TPA: SHOCT domain-containing protein [Solirubrobacteraceae bacterium]
MADQLTPVRIIGVALVLFASVLLGFGIHHLVSTGTCSSTGYSANYGPVPTCPTGTGWWFAFVFVGIIGGIVGGLMAGSIGLLFAGIFGAIGFGALSLVLDSTAKSSTKVFAAAFGGAFAVVGVVAGVAVLVGALSSLRSSLRSGTSPKQVHYGKTKISSRSSSSPQPATTFSAPPSVTLSSSRSSSSMGVPSPTPINLIPGLQAVQKAASGNAIDELSKLATMHEQGNLTDEEFANAKAKLLQQL